jgi:UDP-N-acetylmuramoyl-tripeptide--D-alanyl-D-alanine ligase
MATPIPPNRAPLTAWSAAAATGGAIARIAGDGARATGVTTDSRAVVDGSAFVALRGDTHDGHDYVDEAVRRGARLVVVARDYARPLPDVDVVTVDDTLRAWGAIARAHLRAWRRAHAGDAARVVAITGSAGKTTTKELCAALLATVGPCLATPGNLNNRVGLPAVVLGLERDHRFLVLEMGMSVPGEIAALAEIASPDVAVIVNAGLAHAEGVGGTRAAVAHEKGAIYAALAKDGVAIVSADDPAAAAQVARSVATREETFGRSNVARYRLVDRTPRGETGSRLIVRRAGQQLAIDLPLVGEAAAIDFLAALAAAEAASGRTFTTPIAHEALATLTQPAGRAAARTLEGDVILLDDSYNANPASMRSAIATLVELAQSAGGARRMVAVIGEMKELGPSAHVEHEAIGAALAEAGVALAIGCGGLADAVLDRAALGGVAVVKETTTEAAAIAAEANVRAGDVVLVKGSRSVATEKVAHALARARGGTPAR